MKNLFLVFVRELIRLRGDIELTAEAIIEKGDDGGHSLFKIVAMHSELYAFHLCRQGGIGIGGTSSVQRGVRLGSREMLGSELGKGRIRELTAKLAQDVSSTDDTTR